jgi:hypothetical protein
VKEEVVVTRQLHGGAGLFRLNLKSSEGQEETEKKAPRLLPGKAEKESSFLAEEPSCSADSRWQLSPRTEEADRRETDRWS